MKQNNYDALRDDLIISQKKGLPFILTSILIWTFILIVTLLKLPIKVQNLLVFCCSCPLMPLAWLIGKGLRIDIFDQSNPLSKLGFLFTCNQMLYLLIVMWAFNATPRSMVMLYAIVFGAHLLPYSWLYKSNGYCFFSIFIPIISLIIGCVAGSVALSFSMVVIECLFSISLFIESRKN